MSEINNKSYRVKIDVNSTEKYKVPVKLDRDYNFIEILSLKINQEDFYKLHTSDYGVVVGRVLANGGVGVENAKISVFIPATNETRLDIEKYLIYPYDTLQSKDVNNIRYNLLPSTKLNDCYQVVGTFPAKRFVLDNNTVLEVFDEYYKYTTVTNQAGDYMIYGLPVNDNILHVDLDLSDIGILSQKPRDMFYKGYNVEQFESSTQFKQDVNLNNLTQIISQDQNVFVYPFWGDVNEGETAITRCDINIQYKFEPTCIFMGSVFTDTQEAAILKNCKAQKGVGRMSSLTTGEGKIEMIRKTFDGVIEEFQIKGNRLIDGDGVFCYQIPMNLDYVTTDEFGNLVPTDNPNKGIPTRAEVRFRLSLDNVGDEGFSKKRGEYLVPHNPQTTNEIDFSFDVTTKDTSFVNLFWNKVYSVKSYIPRLQLAPNYNSRDFVGVKTINDYGQNNPFPYNTVYITMPIIFNILCLVTQLVINIVSIINGLFSSLRCMSCGMLGVNPCKVIGNIFSFLSCINIGTGWCVYWDDILVPNCTCKQLRNKVNSSTGVKWDKGEIEDCVTTSLAEENNVYNFDFGNDWINGSVYSPLFQTKIKKKKKRKFLGLFGSRVVSETLTFCGLINNDQNAAASGWLFGRGVGSVRLFSNCVIKLSKSGDKWTKRNDNKDCNKDNCYKQTKDFPVQQGYINQITDEDNNKHYYYIPSIMRTMNGKSYPVLLYAIDVILLGSMNDCDVDGIFPLHKLLPSTTYSLPSPLKDLGEDFDPNDPNNSSSNKQTTTEASGINWGKGGGHPGDDQRPNNTNKRYYNKSSGGLFMGIGCTGSDTYPKTCFNVVRLCEIGVSLDESDVEYNSCNTNGNIIPPDGWILKKDELVQSEVRQMFSTLNSIPFYNRPGDNNIIEVSGRKFYNFKYYYPEYFDGKLYPFIDYSWALPSGINDTNAVNKSNELIDQYYMNFRFGENSNQPQYYYPTDFILPRYVNSFYFYFGIRPGKTAIEKFRSGFYSECVSIIKPPFIVQPKVVNGALVCTCSTNITPVIVEVSIREFVGSYSIRLEDMFGNPISLIPTPPSDLRKTSITITSSSTYSPQDFYSTALASGGIYYLTITDENGVSVRREINIPVFGFVDFDYTTEVITNNTELNPNNYIGVQTLADALNKGKINVFNLGNIAEKGCLLRNFTLTIVRQVRTGTDDEGNAIFEPATTTIYNNSNADWLAISNYFDSGAISTNGNVFTISNGGSGYTAGTVTIVQGTNSTATGTITVSGGVIQTITITNGGSGYTTSTADNPVNIVQGTNSTATGLLGNPTSFTIYLWQGTYTITLQNNFNCPSSCPCRNDFKEINEVFDIVPPIELIIGNGIRAKFLTVNTSNTISSDPNIWWSRFYQYLTNPSTTEQLSAYYNDSNITTSEDIADMKETLQSAFISYCSNFRNIRLTGFGYTSPYKTYLFGKTATPTLPAPLTAMVISVVYGGSGYNQDNAVTVLQGSNASMTVMVNTTLNVITSISSIDGYGSGYIPGPVTFTQGGSINATGYINAPQAHDFFNNSNPIVYPVMTNESTLDGVNQVAFTCRRLLANGNFPSGYTMGGYFAGVIGENGNGNAWNDNFNQYVFNYRNSEQGSTDATIDIFNLFYNANGGNTGTNWLTFGNSNFLYFQLFDRQLRFYLPLFRITTNKANYYPYYTDTITPIELTNLNAYMSLVYFNGENQELSFVYNDGNEGEETVLNFSAEGLPGLSNILMNTPVSSTDSNTYLFGTSAQSLPAIRGFNTTFGETILPLIYRFDITDEYNGCDDVSVNTDIVYNLTNSKISVVDSATVNSILNVSNTATFTVTTSPSTTSSLFLINSNNLNLLPTNILYPTTDSYPNNIYFNVSTDVDAIYSDLITTPPNNFINQLALLTDGGTTRTYIKSPNGDIIGNIVYNSNPAIMTNVYYVIAVKSDTVRTFSQPINLSYNQISLATMDYVNSAITFNFNGYTQLQNFGYTYQLQVGTFNNSYTNLNDFFTPDSGTPPMVIRNSLVNIIVTAGVITTITFVNGGIGNVAGTYDVVQGNNSTAKATITVNTNGTVTGVSIANGGTGYVNGMATVLYNTFTNISVNKRDVNKILQLSVTNVLGVAHVLYTSMYNWILPGQEIQCGLCSGTERTYGTGDIGSTTIPTTFVYYKANLDGIGSIQLDGTNSLMLNSYDQSGTITQATFLGLNIGTASDLPSCCGCNPLLASMSFNPAPVLFTFNPNVFTYNINYNSSPAPTSIDIYLSVDNSSCNYITNSDYDGTKITYTLSGSGTDTVNIEVSTNDNSANNIYSITINYLT